MAAEITPRDQTIMLETTDLSAGIDEKVLEEMGDHIVQIYEEDLESRADWEKANEEWIKLAVQVKETKNYPWPGASSVKYPTLSMASLNFHARAYPALVPDGQLVKMRVLGDDPMNEKRAKADRVSQHMSWQLLEENEDWQEDMDRMMYVLPIIGLAYKKTYYHPILGYNVSKLCLPDDVIINYYAEDYARAIKSHRLYQNENEMYELMALGHYRTVELAPPEDDISHEGVEDEIIGIDAPDRGTKYEAALNDTPYMVIEQHTWWDLDGDGYKEPYIITVEYTSKKVLRVVARWTADNILLDEQGNVMRIVPTEYFTQYGFFPNPESKIYYLGFGNLLGPINAASNTLLNILIDSGHLATLQGGFLGKGVRMKGGDIRFKPGEWKIIQSTGDDIKKNVYPLPVKEPSGVLFNLLGMLIQAGENLSSVKDIMAGENPGQNQPYATTVAVLEQGMKVFVGIYKRLYRSLTKEYKRLFELNKVYLDEQKYFALIDDTTKTISAEDYNDETLDIVPNADPTIISEAHKMMKAQSLLQKLASGLPLNVAEVTRRVIAVEGHENVGALLQPNPPSEDPELTFKKQQAQAEMEFRWKELEVNVQNTQFEAFKDYSQAVANLAKAAATEGGAEVTQFVQLANAAKQEYDSLTQRLKVLQDGLLQRRQQDTAERESMSKETEDSDEGAE